MNDLYKQWTIYRKEIDSFGGWNNPDDLLSELYFLTIKIGGHLYNDRILEATVTLTLIEQKIIEYKLAR